MWNRNNFTTSSGSGLAGTNRREYGIVENFSRDRGIQESYWDPRYRLWLQTINIQRRLATFDRLFLCLHYQLDF